MQMLQLLIIQRFGEKCKLHSFKGFLEINGSKEPSLPFPTLPFPFLSWPQPTSLSLFLLAVMSYCSDLEKFKFLGVKVEKQYSEL